MVTEGKQIFSIGGRCYEIVEVTGPICRGDQTFPTQFDHDSGQLRISSTVPLADRPCVVAAAVSDACFRLWRPIPLIHPNWQPSDRPAGARRLLGPANGRPSR